MITCYILKSTVLDLFKQMWVKFCKKWLFPYTVSGFILYGTDTESLRGRYRGKFSTVTIEKKIGTVPWKIFDDTNFFTVPIHKDPIPIGMATVPIRKDPIPIGMATVPITICGNDWQKRRKRFTVPITILQYRFLGKGIYSGQNPEFKPTPQIELLICPLFFTVCVNFSQSLFTSK